MTRPQSQATPGQPLYNDIGHGYAHYRREDPTLRARIHEALGDAQTVLNVGAGAGSYEPLDRYVLAVEPSKVMATQRRTSCPAIRASAHDLPLHDQSIDATMSVLSLHHWKDAHGQDAREAGVRELRRVTRGPVVIITYDAEVSARMWLMADYFPEVAKLDREVFPDPAQVAQWLGGAHVEPVPIRADSPDWNLGSYWAHPERVLDEAARNATSGFARQPPSVVERVVSAVRSDLDSGAWDSKHGHLRGLTDLDVGLRLVLAV